MKKLVFGLLVLGSFSAFAIDYSASTIRCYVDGYYSSISNPKKENLWKTWTKASGPLATFEVVYDADSNKIIRIEKNDPFGLVEVIKKQRKFNFYYVDDTFDKISDGFRVRFSSKTPNELLSLMKGPELASPAAAEILNNISNLPSGLRGKTVKPSGMSADGVYNTEVTFPHDEKDGLSISINRFCLVD